MHWHGDPILRHVVGRLRRRACGGSTRIRPDRLCWWPKTTSLFRAFRARLINRLTQSTPWFRTSFPDKNNWKKNWGKPTFFGQTPMEGGTHSTNLKQCGHITPPWLWRLCIEFEICRAQQQICQAFPRSLMVSGLKGLEVKGNSRPEPPVLPSKCEGVTHT